MARFLHVNPGLASRFPAVLHFPGYTSDELAEIFTTMASQDGFRLADGVLPRLRELLAATPRGPDFGNARHIRNLLDKTISAQGLRLTSTTRDGVDVSKLLPDDLPFEADQLGAEDTRPGQYL
jgi:AAA lid domain